jgi:hypothetical protein
MLGNLRQEKQHMRLFASAYKFQVLNLAVHLCWGFCCGFNQVSNKPCDICNSAVRGDQRNIFEWDCFSKLVPAKEIEGVSKTSKKSANERGILGGRNFTAWYSSRLIRHC